MALAATDPSKYVFAAYNSRIRGGTLNRSLQRFKIRHYMDHGLITYFRINRMTTISIVSVVGRGNPHILVIGINGLVKQVVCCRFLAQSAHVLSIMNDAIISFGKIGRNSYPVWF